MNSLDNFILEIKKTPEFITYDKYKKLLMKDGKHYELSQQISDISKNMVNAKHLGLDNQYQKSKQEYEQIIKKIEDDVLLNLYLEAEYNFKNLLKNLFDYIGLNMQNYVLNCK